MTHIVQCRACGNRFDTDLLEKEEWILPSKNHYYHRNCYEQWANSHSSLEATLTNEEWFEALKYYLNHIIKAPIDYRKLTSQWNNFLKQKKTAKGIYFAMKYFYDVTNGDKEKSQGGIGIISCIYTDSCDYWRAKFEKDSTIIEKIEEQVRLQLRQRVNPIAQTKAPKKKKKPVSLEEI